MYNDTIGQNQNQVYLVRSWLLELASSILYQLALGNLDTTDGIRVLQCVAARCSVLQCVMVALGNFDTMDGIRVLQCVAARCSALQCVAVCDGSIDNMCVYDSISSVEMPQQDSIRLYKTRQASN